MGLARPLLIPLLNRHGASRVAREMSEALSTRLSTLSVFAVDDIVGQPNHGFPEISPTFVRIASIRLSHDSTDSTPPAISLNPSLIGLSDFTSHVGTGPGPGLGCLDGAECKQPIPKLCIREFVVGCQPSRVRQADRTIRRGLGRKRGVSRARAATGKGAKSGKHQMAKMHLGTLVVPRQMYETGVAESLRQMRELVGINTVMTFTHHHVQRQYRPGYSKQTDSEGNDMTDVFVRTNPKYYANPKLQGKDFKDKFADRDILDELVEAGKPHGMKIYGRILEGYVITGAIPGLEPWAEIDENGERTNHVCFNNPGYQRYWKSVIEDLIRSHPNLDGFKFGQERGGPMHAALSKNTPGHCFCRFCRAKAKRLGIDVNEARKGLKALREFGVKAKSGETIPDGNFVTWMRILMEHPDLLKWEKMWMDSREGYRKRMYKQIKRLNPKVHVGWHIDHSMTWDTFQRASWDYGTMGPYSDWLSVAVYFDSYGRRSLGHFNRGYRKVLLGDLPDDQAYSTYLRWLGMDPANEPKLSEHETACTSMSADYVYQECKRAVDRVAGKAKVYGRPGFDMPGYPCDVQKREVYDAATAALEAGVDGLWCGREWEELQPKNAEAFGNAVRDWERQH